MNNNIVLAINFEYTLMEFYKTLDLNEKELAVIFMVKHLLEQKNTLITADLLSIKMKLSTNEIDAILVVLMQKGFLAYKSSNKGLITSLEPLETKLSEMYQLEIAKDANKKINEKSFNAIKNIYEVFERELGRTLSPVELALIDDWVHDGYKEDDIISALREAIRKKKASLKVVDKILMERQARNDIENEGHTAISETWKKSITDTIDIAKNKWNGNG